MKIHNCKQGEPEWLTLRTGLITGTDAAPWMLEPKTIGLTVPQIQAELDRFGIAYLKSAAKPKLVALLPNPEDYMKLSTAARTLIYKKLAEKKRQDPWQLAQTAMKERQMSHMIPIQRGNALEPAARDYYARRTGNTVVQVGFVSNDFMEWGMSPDGVIYDTKGLDSTILATGVRDLGILKGVEIKCPMPETHTAWLLDAIIPAEHEYQCHMGMVSCECDEWDFLSFCPGEAPLLLTLHRNETTDALAAGLEIIVEAMADIEQELAAKWDDAFGSEENRKLLSYLNGQPMFGVDGMPLDQDGRPIECEPEGRAS